MTEPKKVTDGERLHKAKEVIHDLARTAQGAHKRTTLCSMVGLLNDIEAAKTPKELAAITGEQYRKALCTPQRLVS